MGLYFVEHLIFTIFLPSSGCLKSHFSLHKQESLKTSQFHSDPWLWLWTYFFCWCDFANAYGRSVTIGVRSGMPLGAVVSLFFPFFPAAVHLDFCLGYWPFFASWGRRKAQTSQAKETTEGAIGGQEGTEVEIGTFFQDASFQELRDMFQAHIAMQEAIQNCPLPHTKIQIRSFLGMAGWYRKFVPKLFYSCGIADWFDSKELS